MCDGLALFIDMHYAWVNGCGHGLKALSPWSHFIKQFHRHFLADESVNLVIFANLFLHANYCY